MGGGFAVRAWTSLNFVYLDCQVQAKHLGGIDPSEGASWLLQLCKIYCHIEAMH